MSISAFPTTKKNLFEHLICTFVFEHICFCPFDYLNSISTIIAKMCENIFFLILTLFSVIKECICFHWWDKKQYQSNLLNANQQPNIVTCDAEIP